MKLYYICDYCRELYKSQDVEGPDGSVEVLGVCLDCFEELGLAGEEHFTGLVHYH